MRIVDIKLTQEVIGALKMSDNLHEWAYNYSLVIFGIIEIKSVKQREEGSLLINFIVIFVGR